MAAQQLGSGSFGSVAARQLPSGHVVAVKKILVRRPEEGLPDACLREVNTLLLIRHPNVVKLIRAEITGQHIVLLCELCPTDLAKVINARERPFPDAEVLTATHQLLLGIQAIHAAPALHRDLKPHNVLVSGAGVLKIADFGLARPVVREGGAVTPSVSTRWYRAPEVLFGSAAYGPAVDIWGLGCIVAELLGCAPLFPGEDDVDQLRKIQLLVGTASEASWPGVSRLPDFGKILFPDYPPRDFQDEFPDASEPALAVLADTLALDPARRRTAAEVLQRHFEGLPPPLGLPHWVPAT